MKLAAVSVILLMCGAFVAAFSNDSTASNTVWSSTEHLTKPSTSTSETSTQVSTSAPSPGCQGLWSVPYDDSQIPHYCIIMQADIVVRIMYNNSETEDVQISRNASSKGSCRWDSDNETITISQEHLQLTWTFVKHKNQTSFNITDVKLTYKNYTGHSNVDTPWLNNIASTKTYQCNANETVINGTLTRNDTIARFVITTTHFKLQAFQNTTTCNFNENYDFCSDDANVSNLVPIIVGACLVGLIIIVLIAYLVGRRRSRRGYESV